MNAKRKLVHALGWGGVLVGLAWNAGAQAPQRTVDDRRATPAAGGRVEPEQALYQMLLSEIAGQRGDNGLAVRGMMDLAMRVRDARLARRAVEMGFQARDMDATLEASLLWLDLQPDAALARQALAAATGAYGSAESVKSNLRKAFAGPRRAPPLFMHVNGLLGRLGDKADAAAFVEELAAGHAKLPEAQYALALAYSNANDPERATAAIDRAMATRKDWVAGAILKSRILRVGSLDRAADYMAAFVKLHPAAVDARLQYARLLFAQNALLSAREQFRAVARLQPGDAEHAYAIALMSQQVEDWSDAEAQYRRALELGPKDADAIRHSLGVVVAAQQRPDDAIAWFRQVGPGEYFVNAQLKIAGALAKRDGLAAGRKFLSDARLGEAEESVSRIQLMLAEAQLLRDAGMNVEAYDFLSAALLQHPDTADLLYDRAMVAEKIDRLAEMEADLRRVIDLKPDHAHALNALGYTFAERNIRLDEAEALVRKAIELAPDDAFILDSLGWVHFRRGQLEQALTVLKRAYGIRRDAEIAAHLAEVMLAKGLRDEAQALLRAALLEHPRHEALTAMYKKSMP
ncbi:MAG: tetratricopeptide repeat protein [Betaproteobacteria bacterium]|nr:tetratricopeptide repeat protein [Betaproteobacteria bacterium]